MISKQGTLSAPVLISPTEAVVMRLLRNQKQVSRVEVSEITGWSRAKTSQVVNNLVEKGYLQEHGDGMSRGGRKPRLLRINGLLGYIAGIDIGATSVEIAISDLNGTIIGIVAEPSDVRKGPEDFLNDCTRILLRLATAHNIHPGQILGIGVGVPGPVDFSRGVVVAPPLMPGWEAFPIRAFFQKSFFSAFVVVDNDVNIMAVGEQRSGGAENVDHFLLIKVGTGIGCGIMANRRIHRGSDGSAGDIGHICADQNGPICRCGNRGCLEAMAAGPAIAEKAMQAAREGKSALLNSLMDKNGGVLTPEDVNYACREGDEASLEIIRASGKMIGDVLAGLINFFNPSHVFITGGIANFGNYLLIAIKRAVLRRSLPLATAHLDISFSQTGPTIGVIGAISLALDHLFMVDDPCGN